MVLGVATGAHAPTPSVSDKVPRSPRAQIAASCSEGAVGHVCTYDTAYTKIIYTLEAIPMSAGESMDLNVVPDYVVKWASVSNDAWYYYSTTLSMTSTGDKIAVYLGVPLEGGVCGSWPTDQIFCGAMIPAEQVEYFAAHEMFHQFQWPDIDRAAGSLLALNPWMEATANWASAHFALQSPRSDDSVSVEAATVSYFFSDTANGLVSRGNPPLGVLSDRRAYGSAPIVEYLTERFGDSLVKESFAAITSNTSDGLDQINDALAFYDTSLDDVVDDLWWSMYTMCGPERPDEWDPFGWCWDNVFGVPSTGPGSVDTRRPDHAIVTLSDTPTGTRTDTLRKYGAEFIDFDLGRLPENASGTTLVLRFDSDQVTAGDSVDVVGWKDFPGGEQCQASQFAYPSGVNGETAVAVQIVGTCRYATLVEVNTHTGTSTSATAYPVSWSSFPTGATIGNGTVTVGVNADGNLGLGISQSGFCRPGAAVAKGKASGSWAQRPALVLDTTGIDAIRWNDPCSSRPTQGWSVADTNQTVDDHSATWTKHGLDYPSSYPVPVISFTFTDTEATSVVALGDNYALTQHWGPSSIDPRVYQLDVTIRPTSTLPITVGQQPLIYRQVVPLNVRSWNDDNVRVSTSITDGVTATTNNLYWSWGSGYESSSIDDPLVPLPLTDSNGDGFAFDARIPMPMLFATDLSPQLSVYYGFADSTGEATSILTAAGATTRAIAEVHNYNYDIDEWATSALLVGVRQDT